MPRTALPANPAPAGIPNPTGETVERRSRRPTAPRSGTVPTVTTVREATFELLRARGMTTLFGNPGSTELPMLGEFPADFRYILGLQESVAVGIADGYAQASGHPALVNLHTAPGLGNGMGAIFNAQANKSPLVVTAGQQYRSLMTLQANLTNRDATRMPHPLVKWSWEPPCAQDVPHALARAVHTAGLPPRGPVFVSIPMDDWYAEVRSEDEVRHQTTRAVSGGAGLPDGGSIASIARRLVEASNPALVAGPDIDASGGWDAAVRLAERARLPVYATPATGGGRLGFPENHPLFQAILPPAVQPLGEALAPHDFVLAVGTSIFPYYPNIPGPLLAEGTSLTAITSDPDEAARAPMGDAIVADVGLTLAALADAVGALLDGDGSSPGRAAREAPAARPAPEAVPLERPDEPLDRGAHAGAGLPRLTASSCWSHPRPRPRCATSCASGARGATTSPPAGASASGCRRRSACSWPARSAR